MADPVPPKKPRVNMARAWPEARALICKHRRSLSIGLALMLINRLAGFVLPATSKFLIDDVLGKHDLTKLVPLALAAGAARRSCRRSRRSRSRRSSSIAAQRAITEMRKRVQAHVAAAAGLVSSTPRRPAS